MFIFIQVSSELELHSSQANVDSNYFAWSLGRSNYQEYTAITFLQEKNSNNELEIKKIRNKFKKKALVVFLKKTLPNALFSLDRRLNQGIYNKRGKLSLYLCEDSKVYLGLWGFQESSQQVFGYFRRKLHTALKLL